MFPELHMLGIDLVIRISAISNASATAFSGRHYHGHEDHIGALPYILRDVNAPVYATPMAAGLITENCANTACSTLPARSLPARQPWQLGPFNIEAVHMTHSIWMPCAGHHHAAWHHHSQRRLQDRPTPIDARRRTCMSADYARSGVLLLLVGFDERRAPRLSPSERSVHNDLDRIFVRRPARYSSRPSRPTSTA